MQVNPMLAPNQGLPEIIRVRAIRGFRGVVDGQFGIANPGDVVDVPRALAMEMRACGRALMTNDEKVRNVKYLPERKKPENKALADPVSAQVAAMAKALDALTAVVARLEKAPAK